MSIKAEWTNEDCISRQAAIDALNKMKIYRVLDSDRYVISDCLNKIVNLPSAQPEEQCDNCHYKTHLDDAADEWEQLFRTRRSNSMSDCISRQAAIDAIVKADRNCGVDSAKVINCPPHGQSGRRGSGSASRLASSTASSVPLVMSLGTQRTCRV